MLAGAGAGRAVRVRAQRGAAGGDVGGAAQPAGAPRLPRAPAHRRAVRPHHLPDTAIPQVVRAHKERQVPSGTTASQLRPPAAQAG